MTIWGYLERRGPDVLALTLEHVVLVAVSVALATVIGVALGTLVYRSARGTGLVLISTSSLFTVPALAYFGIFVLVVGLGATPSVLVLVIYALLPIVRNTITGLREVDPAVTKSAVGMGMSHIQRLWRVELPLAWPVILAGVRVSTVMSVGLAAIAAWVSGPGLGAEIFGGLLAIGSARAVPQATVGTVAVVVVALLLDGALALLHRVTTPEGLR